jgi:hypothetical protein
VRARAQEVEGLGYDLADLDEENDDAFDQPEHEPEQLSMSEDDFSAEFDDDAESSLDDEDDSLAPSPDDRRD